MVNYKSVLTTINAKQLAKILIKTVIKYYSLPDFIVTDRAFLFTSKFWSSLCYYLNVKHQLNIAFHPQTNRQTKKQNSTIEVNLQAYCQFEQDDQV